jgi:hypothetical protein
MILCIAFVLSLGKRKPSHMLEMDAVELLRSKSIYINFPECLHLSDTLFCMVYSLHSMMEQQTVTVPCV